MRSAVGVLPIAGEKCSAVILTVRWMVGLFATAIANTGNRA